MKKIFICTLVCLTLLSLPQILIHATDPTYSYIVAQQKWPLLFAQTGPYGIQATNSANMHEIDDVRQDGHTVIITGLRLDPNFNQKIVANDLTLIPTNPSSIMYHECSLFLHGTPSASLPCPADTNPTLQATIVSEIDNFLHGEKIVYSDGGAGGTFSTVPTSKQIIGWWILDDFPGPVKHTLELIKEKIQASPAPFPRATVCGFGGYLDFKLNDTEPFTDGDLYHYFDNAIKNFSPKACDIIVYYPYGVFRHRNSDPSLFDWNMTTLLPSLLQKTKDAGKAADPSWDNNTLIWGAIAHAFGNTFNAVDYVLPRYQDMLTQANSFCTAGATLLSFYTWHDGVKPFDRWHEIYSDPELRGGAKDSAALCHNYWDKHRLGDGNGDTYIDGLDYILWLNHYPQVISGVVNGDFDMNGKVDGADYVAWLNHYKPR